jgi:hypothetical protein
LSEKQRPQIQKEEVEGRVDILSGSSLSNGHQVSRDSVGAEGFVKPEAFAAQVEKSEKRRQRQNPQEKPRYPFRYLCQSSVAAQFPENSQPPVARKNAKAILPYCTFNFLC